jgi:hypothetical protein
MGEHEMSTQTLLQNKEQRGSEPNPWDVKQVILKEN